jgi:DNA-binding CsgD family transcriptional regulator
MPNHFTRQKPEISAKEREELQRWVRRPKTSQALAQRARIILASEGGASDMAIAVQLGTTRETVGKWRRRFLQQGCDGLLDEARPGAPRQIRDEDVERVLTLTLESTPQGCDPLEHPFAGSGLRPQSNGSEPDLARFRFATSPHRDFQALQRSALH